MFTLLPIKYTYIHAFKTAVLSLRVKPYYHIFSSIQYNKVPLK